jgi:hypothetical protein
LLIIIAIYRERLLIITVMYSMWTSWDIVMWPMRRTVLNHGVRKRTMRKFREFWKKELTTA